MLPAVIEDAELKYYYYNIQSSTQRLLFNGVFSTKVKFKQVHFSRLTMTI